MIREPTSAEHALVGRCLLECGILIGSIQEIWTHPHALKALGTWRECVDAVTLLIGGGHGVVPSFIKSCVMQLTQSGGQGITPPFLDDIAEWMTEDPRARAYWQNLVPDDLFPHRCPHCGNAAFVGFIQVDCKAKCLTGT